MTLLFAATRLQMRAENFIKKFKIIALIRGYAQGAATMKGSPRKVKNCELDGSFCSRPSLRCLLNARNCKAAIYKELELCSLLSYSTPIDII